MATADLPFTARGATIRRLPRPARLTLTGLGLVACAIAAVCVAWSLPILSGDWGEVWQPVTLTAALILAEGFETRLPLGRHYHTVSPAEAALAAGLFWLPPAVVVLAAAVGVVISQQLAGGAVLKRLVNAAQYTVATGAAAAVAALGMLGAPGTHFPRATLSRVPGLLPAVTTRWCVVILLAMAVFFVVNHTLVAVVTSIMGGPGLRETWRRAMPPALAHWAANTANGLLGAVLVLREPMLVPIVGGSVALTALSSRAWASSLALRERSRLLADAGRALAGRLGEPLPTRHGARRAPLATVPRHPASGATLGTRAATAAATAATAGAVAAGTATAGTATAGTATAGTATAGTTAAAMAGAAVATVPGGRVGTLSRPEGLPEGLSEGLSEGLPEERPEDRPEAGSGTAASGTPSAPTGVDAGAAGGAAAPAGTVVDAGRVEPARADPARDLDAWQAFVSVVARTLDCDGAAIFLGRPDERILDVIHTAGSPERLPSSGSPMSWEAGARSFATAAGWDTPTLAALEGEDATLGYLAAFGPRSRPGLDGEDVEMLGALANQAATALRTEDLYRAAEGERSALEDIVGHSSDGIYTVTPDRTVRSWNPAMAAITGWSQEEAIGRKCYDLLRARDAKGNYTCVSACPIQAVAASSSEVVRDASILTKDRDTRWINYAHAPILDHRTGRMETDVVVVRDVTRERRTEEAKADFVANISHELRSPLTPIKGFLLTLLREDRWFAEERRRDYYRLMLGQTERLEALIEDLLDVTRVETGVGVLHATSVDAKRVVEQAVARFGDDAPAGQPDDGASGQGRPVAAPGRPITVRVPDEPVTVRANLLRAEQVLGHLLSNAMRYSPEGSPIEVELRIEEDEVIFAVRDAGPGIPADEQTRIFERFHRGGYYMTREPGGAGLGLYLAKRLVEAMGGRIWVDSTLGRGSTFSFALRAVPVSTLEALRKRHRCAG
jgi:PAS domain S-box-containing protein